MCITCGQSQPSFGPAGTKKALRCGNEACRLLGDVDVRSPMCITCGQSQPSFGPAGTKKALRCGSETCRLPSDVNVKNPMCITCGQSQPSFGPAGTKKPLRCGSETCRLPSDVNVKNPMCITCGQSQPSFGPAGTKKPLRCGSETCRLLGDVDVKNSMCITCGQSRPSFGPAGTKKPLRCDSGTCRLPSDVDVKNPMCTFSNCVTTASFGALFSSPSRCAKHAAGLLPRKLLHPKCTATECKERPLWTDQPDNYPLRCEAHQVPTDKNVVERPCSQCGFADFIREGSVCNTCCLFEVKKRQKTKELMVKVLLEAHSIRFVHDLRPEGGCGKARPDFMIDCGTHIIIIEVDEFQHRRTNYDCRCEQVRTINLFQEFGGLRVLFIRYNPDSYVTVDGRKGQGSSAANQKRLLTLIKWSMDNIPEEPLTVRYLCYDKDDGKYDEFVIDYEAGIAEQMEALSL